MPPSQWDHKADKDLLLAVIDEGALKGIVWPKIAVTLQSKGYTFTHEACRQHFQKIRKQSASSSGNGNGIGANNNSSAPSSPKKRPTPRKPSAATSAKNQTTGYGAGVEDENDDEEDMPPPPSAKRKRVMKKEESAANGRDERPAYQFKIEQLGGAEHADAVDLEHDE
ncbi:hypothetical protein BKA65DRAFT_545537 [Rhexocercosporidium sp. MPI-PUGE-AT-0058]|nr:hypothetical protein BKA65DRAFT_545537 [Rhexocercosporidium sp. MPI-PUGE-AT-0058]